MPWREERVGVRQSSSLFAERHKEDAPAKDYVAVAVALEGDAEFGVLVHFKSVHELLDVDETQSYQRPKSNGSFEFITDPAGASSSLTIMCSSFQLTTVSFSGSASMLNFSQFA